MTDLTSKAMLVQLNIRQWTARRFDREASEEITEIHAANSDAGRFNKLLLPKAALQGLTGAVTALRTHHATNTLPWTLTGVGLLPAQNYFPYMGEHKRLALLHATAKGQFLDGYAAAKANARKGLGTLYREEDYPAVEDLEQRIALDLQVMPLPDASDFRVTLGSEEEARIRAEIEASVNSAIDGAVRSLWQRVHDTVSAMNDRLTKYRRDPETEKVEHPFRDSIVTNMRELVDLLGRLNVNGDAGLESCRQLLAEKLCVAEPEDLRKDESLRAAQAAECQKVLDRMAAYIGTPPQMAAA